MNQPAHRECMFVVSSVDTHKTSPPSYVAFLKGHLKHGAAAAVVTVIQLSVSQRPERAAVGTKLPS